MLIKVVVFIMRLVRYLVIFLVFLIFRLDLIYGLKDSGMRYLVEYYYEKMLIISYVSIEGSYLWNILIFFFI